MPDRMTDERLAEIDALNNLELLEAILLEHSFAAQIKAGDKFVDHPDGWLHHSCMSAQESALEELVKAGVYELHEDGHWYRRLRKLQDAK